jgi:thioredoxin reductase (NADPH)
VISTTPLRDRRPLMIAPLPRSAIFGDVRAGSVKRVAAGVGEGSMVIAFVHQYLANAAQSRSLSDAQPATR